MTHKAKELPSSWFTAYKWLTQLKNGGMSCLWCSITNNNNESPFGNSKSCFNFRIKTLIDHQDSEKHKLNTISFLKAKIDDEKEKGIISYFNNRDKISNKSLNLLITTCYFCAWHMKPLLFNEHLNLHLKRCELPLGDHYTNDTAVREIVLSLGYTLQILLQNEVSSKNSFVSLLLDESTDCSQKSKLLMIIRYCEDFVAKEKYLAISTLSSATAESIYNVIWNILCRENYVTERLISVLADNAPTMQGKVQGVITKIQEQIPHVKEGRCVSHLANLVVKSFVDHFQRIWSFKTCLYKFSRLYQIITKEIHNFPQ